MVELLGELPEDGSWKGRCLQEGYVGGGSAMRRESFKESWQPETKEAGVTSTVEQLGELLEAWSW